MSEAHSAHLEEIPPPYTGPESFVADWSSDQTAFKNVPWGKVMMWIFLVSDTFIFLSLIHI